MSLTKSYCKSLNFLSEKRKQKLRIVKCFLDIFFCKNQNKQLIIKLIQQVKKHKFVTRFLQKTSIKLRVERSITGQKQVTIIKKCKPKIF